MSDSTRLPLVRILVEAKVEEAGAPGAGVLAVGAAHPEGLGVFGHLGAALAQVADGGAGRAQVLALAERAEQVDVGTRRRPAVPGIPVDSALHEEGRRQTYGQR